MAERFHDDILKETADKEEEGNTKEDEVNHDSELAASTDQDVNEREPVSKAIFFESLPGHVSVSSSEELSEKIVDSTQTTKELVEQKVDVSGRRTAMFDHFSTFPEKNVDHTQNKDLVVSSKVVSERNLEPSKNMVPAVSSKQVSARNREHTNNPELVVQESDVSETKTTSKEFFVDSLGSSPIDNYPSKYRIILYNIDSPPEIVKAEAIAKARKSSDEGNHILKTYLRKAAETKDNVTHKSDIRESSKETLSEVDLQTIEDVVLEKVDAATQTDEVFSPTIFRLLEKFGNTTVEIDMNNDGSTAAAATSSMVPLRTRSNTESRTGVDFNNLPLFFVGKTRRRSFTDIERLRSASKSPIKWEDVNISWQSTPTCYTPSVESLGKDDPISRTFSEMHDQVDQVMDNLRLWESKYSGASTETPEISTDILRQEPDKHNPLLSPITLTNENPTIEEGLKVRTFVNKTSSESTEKSLELLVRAYQEAPSDDSTELCGTRQPISSDLEGRPQEHNFSFSQFIFPSVLIDNKEGQYNPRIEDIDYEISITPESVASLHISEEATILSDSE